MPSLRLASVLIVAACFAAGLSRVVTADNEGAWMRTSSLSLCDSAGRRPCP